MTWRPGGALTLSAACKCGTFKPLRGQPDDIERQYKDHVASWTGELTTPGEPAGPVGM